MASHKRQATRSQARRSRRRQRRVALLLLMAMVCAFASTLMVNGTSMTAYGAAPAFDTTHAVTAASLAATPAATPKTASRSAVREPQGTWSLGETVNKDDMVGIQADNPLVQDLINHRDKGQYPTDLNPNHATGDYGNGYAFSQCTWWAYKRRHQLGLPAGTRMGNGRDWANSARKLGYWVDRTPRQGDVMVFRAGQDGSSPVYGHVAIVENVNEDGSVDTSECGAAYAGKPFTRHFTASQAADHEFIHY
ncbi:CHAP domain-containing protein [Bifidobacterium callitrichos]|nr:CHAP domain-containing protein [Bifidobacterium callitrichos]